MRKNYKIILTVLFFVGISIPAQATPYMGADIELQGIGFSSISSGTAYNDLTGRYYVWGTAGQEAIYTKWSGLWVKYSTHLTPGNWNIGLNAINYGNTLGSSGWYTSFNISSNLTPGNNATDYSIPASSTEVNHGFFNLDIQADGDYTVTYSWTNDLYNSSTGQDANIEIVSAFFDNTATSTPVPEPASILLFSIGLAGLAALKRNKRKRKAA